MKIKYIGNFNDGTGWSKASTYNLLAIDYAGYDVYAEEMKYSKNHLPLEDRVQELMAKNLENLMLLFIMFYQININIMADQKILDL